MLALGVILDGEGSRPGWAGEVVHHVTTFEVSGLPAGMSSGKPSVALLIDLPNGEHVFAETSLALFLGAADALRARYGDPRREP